MKPIRFHPEADSEMVDAAVWYESQQKGLGRSGHLNHKCQTIGASAPTRVLRGQ